MGDSGDPALFPQWLKTTSATTLQARDKNSKGRTKTSEGLSSLESLTKPLQRFIQPNSTNNYIRSAERLHRKSFSSSKNGSSRSADIFDDKESERDDREIYLRPASALSSKQLTRSLSEGHGHQRSFSSCQPGREEKGSDTFLGVKEGSVNSVKAIDTHHTRSASCRDTLDGSDPCSLRKISKGPNTKTKDNFENNFPTLCKSLCGELLSDGIVERQNSRNSLYFQSLWGSKLADLPEGLPQRNSPDSALSETPLSSRQAQRLVDTVQYSTIDVEKTVVAAEKERLEIEQSKKLIPIQGNKNINGKIGSKASATNRRTDRRYSSLSGSSTPVPPANSSVVVSSTGSSKKGEAVADAATVVLARKGSLVPPPRGGSFSEIPLVGPHAVTLGDGSFADGYRQGPKAELAVCIGSVAAKERHQKKKDREDFFETLRGKSAGVTTKSGFSSVKRVPSEPIVTGTLVSEYSKTTCSSNGSMVDGEMSLAQDCVSKFSTIEISCKDIEEAGCLCLPPSPEEERFLCSLGWDKDAQVDLLTKEEIEAFKAQNSNKDSPVCKPVRRCYDFSPVGHFSCDFSRNFNSDISSESDSLEKY